MKAENRKALIISKTGIVFFVIVSRDKRTVAVMDSFV